MSTASTSATTPDLAFGQTWPTLDVFGVLARDRRVIPVVRRLMGDAETPVGVYRKLAADRPGTFLLESAEHGGVWSRWSIVGAASAATLTERDGQAHWVGEPPVGVPTTGLATEALRGTMEALATEPIAGLPPLTGGMVGAITYDAVRRWERVPETTPDELELPELALMLATDLAVLDHTDGSILLVANAINYDDTDERVELAWADAVAASRRHDPRPGRPGRRARSPSSTPRPSTRPWRRCARTRPASGTRRSSSSPRRTSGPARCSRSFSRNGSRSTAPPTRSTSTGRCAPGTPARTCTSSACRHRTARPTPSSAAAPRRWCG